MSRGAWQATLSIGLQESNTTERLHHHHHLCCVFPTLFQKAIKVALPGSCTFFLKR